MDLMSSTYNSTIGAIINPTSAHLATFDDLYKGVDPTELNYAEQLWLQWYMYWGNPVLATGIMSFVLHEVSGELASHRAAALQ